MKKLTSFALSLSLVATLATPLTATAVNVDEKFPAVSTYTGYADVSSNDWFYANAKLCYETGLMTGTDAGFAPNSVMTVAEVVMIAARFHSLSNGGDGVIGNDGANWYDSAIGYIAGIAVLNGTTLGTDVLNIILAPTAQATRLDFLKILALMVDKAFLTPINSITSLPDTSDSDVLAFYNAGILTGTDTSGTFQPTKTLTRAEAAAMISRLVRTELRQDFTPTMVEIAPVITPSTNETYVDYGLKLLNLSSDSIAVTTNDFNLTVGSLVPYLASNTTYLAQLCYYEGMEFDWSNTIGDTSFSTYVLSHSINSALFDAWITDMIPNVTLSAEVEAYIASVDPLEYQLYGMNLSDYRKMFEVEARIDQASTTLATNPNYIAWMAANPLYAAKHILVDNDIIAELFHEVLVYDPSQFDTLMNEHSTDPGLASNPDGYIFTTGEMIAEFETVVKQTAVGGISAPFESTFGWHIVQRLDVPTSYYTESYIDQLFSTYVSTATTNFTEAFGSVNLASFYTALAHVQSELLD